MSLFTNEEFGHLAIRLNECRCPICKRIAEKICDDHKGINPYEQRIDNAIEKLQRNANDQSGWVSYDAYKAAEFAYRNAISILEDAKGGK